jgi:hypothetical protein
VVVRYDDVRSTLIAQRNIDTGEETFVERSDLFPAWRTPKRWCLTSLSELEKFVNEADPLCMEGAVVVDSKFNRVKVKNKAWVLSSRTKDSLMSSPRNLLEFIVLEKQDDVVHALPEEVRDYVAKMQSLYVEFCRSTDEKFRALKAEAGDDRKAFALKVQSSGDWETPYFHLLRDENESTKEWLKRTCESGKLTTRMMDTIIARMGL